MIRLESLGFGLCPVNTRDGSKVWQLETPFKLADEFVFDIFIEQVGPLLHIFDDGFTFHDLLALGIDFSHTQRIESIRNQIKKYGVTFTDDGSFEAFGAMDHSGDIVSKYISAMVSVDQWVSSVFAKHSTKSNLIERSKMLFKKWKPDSKIVDRPKIVIATGKQLEFDFSVDNQFVDAFCPVQQSVQSFVYKAVSSGLARGNPIDILGIIDDSENKKEANQSKTVVSQVAKIILLTDLEKQANVNSESFNKTA